MVIAVPFSGDSRLQRGEKRAYPLRAIVKLVKHHENHVATIEPAEMLALLLACSPCVNQDSFRQNRLMENLQSLIQSIAGYSLSFSLKGGFWGVLKKKPVITAGSLH
jgi:hypothetical protein